MRGYKATNKDGTCRDMLFEVGKIYNIDTELKLCNKGIHFCKEMLNVYNYYQKSIDTRIFEVEALGSILTEGDKSCTNKIKIIRELSTLEILDFVIKNNNSGHRNSGNHNSGQYNSGYYNSGNCNSGNYNSGDCNSGHRNSGFFNTTTPALRLFNKDSNLEFNGKEFNRLKDIKVIPILQWVIKENMTSEEISKHPSCNTTGGFLRYTGRNDYSKLTEEDKTFIKGLPGYNSDIFFEITGVRI